MAPQRDRLLSDTNNGSFVSKSLEDRSIDRSHQNLFYEIFYACMHACIIDGDINFVFIFIDVAIRLGID